MCSSMEKSSSTEAGEESGEAEVSDNAKVGHDQVHN
jgi:hypothetical protein